MYYYSISLFILYIPEYSLISNNRKRK